MKMLNATDYPCFALNIQYQGKYVRISIENMRTTIPAIGIVRLHKTTVIIYTMPNSRLVNGYASNKDK